MKLNYFRVNDNNQFYRVITEKAQIEKHKITVLVAGETYIANSAYEIPKFLHGNMLWMFLRNGNLYPLPKEASLFQDQMARNYYEDDLPKMDLVYSSDKIQKKLKVLAEKKEKLQNLLDMYKEMLDETKDLNSMVIKKMPFNNVKVNSAQSEEIKKSGNDSKNTIAKSVTIRTGLFGSNRSIRSLED